MISIFHGDNVAQSRKAYTSLRDNGTNHVIFDGNSIALTDIVQATQSQDLFDASAKTICIEEFLSKRKPSKETDALIEIVQKAGNDNNILIWESKVLIPAQIKMFSKATLQKFDFPNVLFTFLDNIKPNNAKQTIKLFHQCLQTEEVELLFFMMIRQVRMLLALCQPDKNNVIPVKTGISKKMRDPHLREDDMILIDEIKRMQPWQKAKLQKQAQLFGTEKLLTLYDSLFTIDYGQKTGRLAMNLIEAIDFLFINL